MFAPTLLTPILGGVGVLGSPADKPAAGGGGMVIVQFMILANSLMCIPIGYITIEFRASSGGGNMVFLSPTPNLNGNSYFSLFFLIIGKEKL